MSKAALTAIGLACGMALLSVIPLLANATGSEVGSPVGRVDARVLPGKAPIPGFALDAKSFPLVNSSEEGSPPQLTTTIQGASDPESSLLDMSGTSREIPLGPNGSFRLEVPISKSKTELTLIAINPYGKVSERHILLAANDWDVIQKEIHPPTTKKEPSRFHWSLGLGVTHLDYSRTQLPQLSSVLLSTSGYAEYWLKPDQWDVAFSGYYTPFSFTTDPSGYSIEFLGLNARAGYVLPWIGAPWRLTLMVGLYYATTFTSSPVGGFGYVNIGGPEIYPTLSRTLNSGARASAYFKLSPVSDQFTILSLANREIAAGLEYDFVPDRTGHSWLARFDWANLVVNDNGLQASSSTLSLSAGYRW